MVSARIVGAWQTVVEGAVEMQIAAAGKALEDAFVPDLHGVEEHGVIAQLDLESAQRERHFEEVLVQSDRAVLAHNAFGAGVKKRGDFLGLFEVAERMGVTAEALLRALAGGAVDAQVVEGGDPMRESGIELLQTVHRVSFHAQGQLEVVLDGLNEPLDFAFTPSVIGFCVQEADAKVGADDWRRRFWRGG